MLLANRNLAYVVRPEWVSWGLTLLNLPRSEYQLVRQYNPPRRLWPLQFSDGYLRGQNAPFAMSASRSSEFRSLSRVPARRAVGLHIYSSQPYGNARFCRVQNVQGTGEVSMGGNSSGTPVPAGAC